MCGTFFLALLAVLFPPLPVWIKRGICSADSLINILLCVLGFLPGLLHAWYIIAKYPEEPIHRYALVDAEQGHAHRHGNAQPTTVYAPHPHPQQHAGNKKQGQLMPASGQQNYGTTSTNNGHAGGASGPQFLPSVTPAADNANAGEGGSSSQQQPPSYHEAIQGDHKVQMHD